VVDKMFPKYNNIKKKFYVLIFITCLHAIEDALENYTKYNIESIIKNIDGPADNDTFIGFLGDIFYGFLGSLVAFTLV
jgi:hypothetical protein